MLLLLFLVCLCTYLYVYLCEDYTHQLLLFSPPIDITKIRLFFNLQIFFCFFYFLRAPADLPFGNDIFLPQHIQL